jgi:hypothetical protein
MGEVSPYVGKHTFIMVLAPRETGIVDRYVDSTEMVELEEAFKRFGPQEFDGSWKLSTASSWK